MSILVAILIFSFLIFIHELGHFVAAKLSGVQVNEFSIFMGPAIFKKTVGETQYSIRCIPIGGYCAMEGEDGGSDNPRAFRNASWWKRLIILVAGSFMNLVIGVLIMVIVFLPMTSMGTAEIDSFADYSTINGENGLQVGDKILEIDGEKVYVHSDFSTLLMLKPAETHDLVIERNGEEIELKNFKMEKHKVVTEVLDENGNPVKDENGNIVTQEDMLYGFSFKVVQNPTFGQKLSFGLRMSVNSVRNVRMSLQMLVTGQVGLKDVGGPVMIVDQMSQVADQSATWVDALLNMLYFGGFIAINLAVMNMLPIPALDGGRVLCLLLTTIVEGVTRKKINPKFEGYLHTGGMIVLLALMAIILFKDVFVIFTR